MLLDRNDIEMKYSVLPYVPTAQATEELNWVTNIFVSADLTEQRTSLAQYPAMKVTYRLVVTPDNRFWLNGLYGQDRNEWVLPYFPHLSTGRVLSGGQIVISSAGGHAYPYANYCCVYNQDHIVYREIFAQHGDGSDVLLLNPLTQFRTGTPVFVAPCFTAFINPKISYRDLGPNRYGGSVNLQFRMTGESEKALNYHVDEFDFIEAAQIPLNTNIARRQLSFAPQPAKAHAYTPNAYRENQTPMTRVTYWLDYDNFNRLDYTFRGAFMKRLGSFTAGNYLNSTTLHRIEDDKITINYDVGVAKAQVMMREVAA